MKYPAYPKYKSSGVEWLGDVPEHWMIKRLKHKVSINDETHPETTNPDLEIIYVDISSVDSVRGIINKEPMLFENAPSRARRIVRDGDTIISTVRTYLRAIAPIEKPDDNLTVSTGFAVVRPKSINKKYLSKMLIAPFFVEEVVSGSVGVSYPAINASDIGLISVPLPSDPEQQAIAEFLDRETGRIDELIGKKESLIDLLKEKRTAMISHAVTKGLKPNVKMKPSGEEWLGDVPEHWEVKRLKYLLQEPLQYGANEAAELDDPELPRFVRITDIDESGNLRDETFRSLPEDIAKPFLLDEGDLLFARSGATVGKTFYYRKSWGKAAYAGYLIRARFKKRIIYPDFINYITKSSLYAQWINSILIQATIQNVSAEKYASYVIPMPQLNEQQAIAEFLDRETGKIDSLISKVESAIEKLKEYRTALISAAVTGKIDVREVA